MRSCYLYIFVLYIAKFFSCIYTNIFPHKIQSIISSLHKNYFLRRQGFCPPSAKNASFFETALKYTYVLEYLFKYMYIMYISEERKSRLVRQRSVSLPDGGKRKPWQTLGLYLKVSTTKSIKSNISNLINLSTAPGGIFFLRGEIPFSKACRLVTLALIAPTSPGFQFYKELVSDPLVILTAILYKQTWLSG